MDHEKSSALAAIDAIVSQITGSSGIWTDCPPPSPAPGAAAAQAEHAESTENKPYVCPIPADVKPPASH